MAKIIYKEGCEGQNKLSCIEGIEIEMLNGWKCLIYPKYAISELLFRERIEAWGAPALSEIEALRNMDIRTDTETLISIGSPAALWVSQFSSDKCGQLCLPSLLAAMEINGQREAINTLALEIEGADIIPDKAGVWSSSRCSSAHAWYANGYYGIASYGYLSNRCLAVPVGLYR